MPKEAWPIIGNANALDFFESLLAEERREPGSIGGVYLVTGPEKVGRSSAVEFFIKKLLGTDDQHPGETIDMWPDIFRLRREEDKREIGVDQARDFSARLSLSSFTASYRVGIIHDAHLLSTEAANALLKTLEETRDQAIVFLIAHNSDQLPQTVVSRSQIVAFRAVAVDEIYDWLISVHSFDRPFAKNIARLSGGRPGLALDLGRDKELLEKNLAPARVLIASFKQKLFERWKAASVLLSENSASAADAAEAIVDDWRCVVRDIIMTQLNQPEYMRYAFLEEEIRQVSRGFGISEARRLDERLQKSAAYLKSNVSPATVLENILITL